MFTVDVTVSHVSRVFVLRLQKPHPRHYHVWDPICFQPKPKAQNLQVHLKRFKDESVPVTGIKEKHPY